jgi:hydroxymethylpyrimidine/phosphomethylpyrimidine kinase
MTALKEAIRKNDQMPISLFYSKAGDATTISVLGLDGDGNLAGLFRISQYIQGKLYVYTLDMVFTDIFPDAVKIGMTFRSDLIEVIADRLSFYKAGNIVLDPVMVATSGAKLISDEAIETLKKELLPLATVITPNIPEAEVLFGRKITNEKEMEEAAKKIHEDYGCAVLLKGGHSLNDANDFLYPGNEDGRSEEGIWFYGKKINNPNTHGTGCTLSSAIASNLAKGFTLAESVKNAKDYISGALEAMLDLGKGSGPLAHNWNIK